MKRTNILILEGKLKSLAGRIILHFAGVWGTQGIDLVASGDVDTHSRILTSHSCDGLTAETNKIEVTAVKVERVPDTVRRNGQS